MGTEIWFVLSNEQKTQEIIVKLNNPLMGTETNKDIPHFIE